MYHVTRATPFSGMIVVQRLTLDIAYSLQAHKIWRRYRVISGGNASRDSDHAI